MLDRFECQRNFGKSRGIVRHRQEGIGRRSGTDGHGTVVADGVAGLGDGDTDSPAGGGDQE
ncbi:hypothetical protein ABT263_25375 [Kitasatospora sp. NPDC001603]|uniref:hypothetical protein n=1 Tax=Kitasatospora sp. NPDC001603 TaxID=3154388 RepID=UPI00332AFFF4